MVLRRLRRREVRRSRLWQFIVGVGLIVGALIVAWQVNESRQDSEIREGAVVAGVDIGGLEPEEAVIALEPVVREVAETIIELQFQDQIITITAAELESPWTRSRPLPKLTPLPRHSFGPPHGSSICSPAEMSVRPSRPTSEPWQPPSIPTRTPRPPE